MYYKLSAPPHPFPETGSSETFADKWLNAEECRFCLRTLDPISVWQECCVSRIFICRIYLLEYISFPTLSDTGPINRWTSSVFSFSIFSMSPRACVPTFRSYLQIDILVSRKSYDPKIIRVKDLRCKSINETAPLTSIHHLYELIPTINRYVFIPIRVTVTSLLHIN